MSIVSANQKEEWNQFVVANNGSFLQSWQWGELQESMNRRIWRLETERLKGLIIEHNLPLGKNYLYCPYGPIGQGNLHIFLEEAGKIARQERSIFFKIEPKTDLSLKDFKFIKSKKQIQPSLKTIILDISKSAEELLAQMHQKTRYNIRLARRKGVKIEISSGNNHQEIDKFLELSAATAKRDKFHLHPREYYKKMLEILGGQGMIKLFLAKYQNQIIAANLICFFGQTATYLHGASDYNFRQLMAPYLLQWQAILEAKQLGLKYYDFWGIDEEKWPGVTRFKKGFNGQEITYPGAFDLVFQPTWYRVYNLTRYVL